MFGPFFKRIALYSLAAFPCLVFFSLIVYSLPGEYFDGYYDDNVRSKYAYYESSRGNYNTIIVGSSRVYRHLDPILFDSLTTSCLFRRFRPPIPRVFGRGPESIQPPLSWA